MRNCLRILISFLVNPFRPPFAAGNYQDVRRDDEWYAKEFTPVEGKEYDTALTFAMKKWADIESSLMALDKKAEWIFGIGTLSISAAFLVLKERQISPWLAIPFLVFAAWGILGALRARLPGEKPTPTSIRGVLECTAKTSNAKSWICASLQSVCSALGYLTQWKGMVIQHACYSIFIAMILLGIGAICSSPVSQNSSPTKYPQKYVAPAPVQTGGMVQEQAAAASDRGRERLGWEVLLKVEKVR